MDTGHGVGAPYQPGNMENRTDSKVLYGVWIQPQTVMGREHLHYKLGQWRKTNLEVV